MRWYYTTTAIWQTNKREREKERASSLLQVSRRTVLLLSQVYKGKGPGVGPLSLGCHSCLIVAISRAQVKHAVCDLVTNYVKGYVFIN